MLDLEKMNVSQREAVTHGAGPLLVLAGPGSGKTHTITQRIFYLLQEQRIPPQQILVVTFTKDAALSMQRRFQEQADRIYPVNFGTFHSIFYHILRESHSLQVQNIAAEARKKEIMIPILRKFFPVNIPSGELEADNRSSAAEEAGAFLSAISFYKNTEDEEEAKRKLPMERQDYFWEVFQAYEKECRTRCLIDFDDMVYQCRKLLQEEEGIRHYWQSRFSHILMDEFQDINPVQYETVKLLAGDKCQLFAVGDDDQAIYGFRGSRPACLKQFAEEFQAKQICLNINYRSEEDIVNASLKVISENKERFLKELAAAAHGSEKAAFHGNERISQISEGVSHGCEIFCYGSEKSFRKSTESLLESASSPVRLICFEDREDQYAYLAEELRRYLQRFADASGGEEGELQQSMAVLFRTNSYMQGFAARLTRSGIPYSMKEKAQSIYEHFLVKDIMAYLRLAAGVGNRELLLQILNKPLRYLNREALGRKMENREFSLSYALQHMIVFYHSQENAAYCRERIQEIEKMKKDFEYLSRLPLYLGVQFVLKRMGYEKYLRERAGSNQEKIQEWQEHLERLLEEAKEYDHIGNWLQAQEAYNRSRQDNKAVFENKSLVNNKAAPENKLQFVDKSTNEKQAIHSHEEISPIIQLMTVHASKGLEFDHVWIPDCNEKVFPHGHMPDTAACEEERRIFYVAMTRAKKSLELLCLTGTKERPRLPSRFLNQLLSESSSISSSNSQLSRYSSKASATFSYSSSSSI